MLRYCRRTHSKSDCDSRVHLPVFFIVVMGSVRRHMAGPQCTFREMKLHKHSFRDFSPCHWALNIVNSCVKVSVVVINKHAQRDLVFDKKVKEQVPFDRTLLRAATKHCVCRHGNWQTVFSLTKAVVGWTCHCRWRWSDSLYNELHTIQRLIRPFFLCLCLSRAFLCLSFRLSARRTTIFFFDAAQLWHCNQHFAPTPLPTGTWKRSKWSFWVTWIPTFQHRRKTRDELNWKPPVNLWHRCECED